MVKQSVGKCSQNWVAYKYVEVAQDDDLKLVFWFFGDFLSNINGDVIFVKHGNENDEGVYEIGPRKIKESELKSFVLRNIFGNVEKKIIETEKN